MTAQIERDPTPAETEAIRDLYRHMARTVKYYRLNKEAKNVLRHAIMEKYEMGWAVPMIAERYDMRVAQVMDVISSFGDRP